MLLHIICQTPQKRRDNQDNDPKAAKIARNI